MHGVTKTEYQAKRTEAHQRERALKAAKYSKVIAAIRQRRAQKLHDAESLGLTSKILELNPEFYTLWNFRKEILLQMFAAAAEASQRQALNAEELRLTLTAIKRQPKSYAAWYHRKWVVCKAREAASSSAALAAASCDMVHELALCTKFLELDERNFHCWAYRRYVCDCLREDAAAAGAGEGGGTGAAADSPGSVAAEFAFATSKLNQNFSNYSAFHHRTTLLPTLLEEGSGGAEQWEAKMREELELVQQAVFTEPDDQSAWLYYDWLLQQVAARAQSPVAQGVTGAAVCSALLREQLSTLLELLEVEEGSKWATLTVERVQRLLVALSDTDAQAASTLAQECSANLRALAGSDADHRGYYEHIDKLVSLHVS